MNRSLRWLARGLLLSASLALVLAVGECVVARVAPQNLSIWDNLRDGMTVHRPNADSYLTQFGRRVETNGLGMRDRERSVAKPADTLRILVLGDSFMEALQVPLERALPALLEQRLKAEQKKVEVVNLSVSGWGTDDEVTYLERHGMQLAPDGILIMMTLHNDVADNAQQEFHRLENDRLIGRPIDEMPWSRFAIQKTKAYLAGRFHLYQLAYQTSIRGRVKAGAVQLDRHVASLLRRDASPELEQDWELTFALLDQAARLARREHAWLAIGMIPLWTQVDDAAYRRLLDDHGLDGSLMDREGPQRRIRVWAAKRGIALIDLLPDFVETHRTNPDQDAEPLYLPSDGHWGASGHALAAKRISHDLVNGGFGLEAAR